MARDPRPLPTFATTSKILRSHKQLSNQQAQPLFPPQRPVPYEH